MNGLDIVENARDRERIEGWRGLANFWMLQTLELRGQVDEQRAEIERLRGLLEKTLHTYENITTANFSIGLDKPMRDEIRAALERKPQ